MTAAIGVPQLWSTGQKVEFGVKIVHGAFQGTLSAEGADLAGQFAHEQGSMPLTLRKK